MKPTTTTVTRKSPNLLVGIFLVLLGVLWLLDEMNIYIPSWIVSWQMFLIALGVIFGVQSSFRNPTSYILILIGGAFLLADYFDLPIDFWSFFWPAILIIIGIAIMLKPRQRWKHYQKDIDYTEEQTAHSPDTIRVNAILNGSNKNVVSQNFKGGTINSIMGGVEINFSRADIESKALIELSIIMGGLKMIVPPDWQVETEADIFMGSLEEDAKVFVLTGSVIMGGVEIVSY